MTYLNEFEILQHLKKGFWIFGMGSIVGPKLNTTIFDMLLKYFKILEINEMKHVKKKKIKIHKILGCDRSDFSPFCTLIDICIQHMCCICFALLFSIVIIFIFVIMLWFKIEMRVFKIDVTSLDDPYLDKWVFSNCKYSLN